MKTMERGKKEAKKVAKKVSQGAKKLAKKATGGADLLRSKWEKEEKKWRKAVEEKEATIKKLKGQMAEKEKAIKETQKSLLDRAKDGLLELKRRAQAEVKEKAESLAAQKNTLVEKLKKELAEREGMIRQSETTLREAMDLAGKEVSAVKEKTGQTLAEWKNRAEAEYKKLKGELESKTQTLSSKVKELEEYRKAAEVKITELRSKAKELTGKGISGEKERRGLVTFKGNPMTLLGGDVKVGDRAPDFQVIDNAMQPTTLASFKGKIKIISAVPSLDTPVCDMETRRFNEEAGKLPDKVAVLTISMDLPFAQKRWCAAAGVEKVKTFSDYQNRSFGLAYGMLIKELKLLARAVFIVDDQDLVRYIEIVSEIAQEPDYDRVLQAVKALL